IFMNFLKIEKIKLVLFYLFFYFVCKDMISTIGTTTIQTTAPNSLVMNPTSMLVEMKSFIPPSYTFETEIQKIKQEL
ncbi:organellar and viral DNA polymerase type B, partial [Trichomonas vaginalis G3]|uniref:organellar and viral DNA polymerase type B n=1 Tax=Trichomonas vaginalis (strain ATCC PRA-98 / G3) TaxID=412133 RepID=UPI0021E61E60